MSGYRRAFAVALFLSMPSFAGETANSKFSRLVTEASGRVPGFRRDFAMHLDFVMDPRVGDAEWTKLTEEELAARQLAVLVLERKELVLSDPQARAALGAAAVSALESKSKADLDLSLVKARAFQPALLEQGILPRLRQMRSQAELASLFDGLAQPDDAVAFEPHGATPADVVAQPDELKRAIRDKKELTMPLRHLEAQAARGDELFQRRLLNRLARQLPGVDDAQGREISESIRGIASRSIYPEVWLWSIREILDDAFTRADDAYAHSAARRAFAIAMSKKTPAALELAQDLIQRQLDKTPKSPNSGKLRSMIALLGSGRVEESRSGRQMPPPPGMKSAARSDPSTSKASTEAYIWPGAGATAARGNPASERPSSGQGRSHPTSSSNPSSAKSGTNGPRPSARPGAASYYRDGFSTARPESYQKTHLAGGAPAAAMAMRPTTGASTSASEPDSIRKWALAFDEHPVLFSAAGILIPMMLSALLFQRLSALSTLTIFLPLIAVEGISRRRRGFMIAQLFLLSLFFVVGAMIPPTDYSRAIFSAGFVCGAWIAYDSLQLNNSALNGIMKNGFLLPAFALLLMIRAISAGLF